MHSVKRQGRIYPQFLGTFIECREEGITPKDSESRPVQKRELKGQCIRKTTHSLLNRETGNQRTSLLPLHTLAGRWKMMPHLSSYWQGNA